MARYSSESDSDYTTSKYRKKYSRKSRSSSSDSSDSSSHRKKSSRYSNKSKRRHRSHSRSRGKDRSSRSYRNKSSSRDRDRRRYHSRTRRSHSSDRSKRKNRSISRDKSRSRSSSSVSNVKAAVPERSHNPILKDEFLIEPRFKEGVLEEINSEGFTPKQFTSSSSTKESKFKNIVIDISADTIQVSPVTDVAVVPDSIFHPSISSEQEARFEKWVKKLYTLRQKAIAEIPYTSTI